MSKLTIKVRTEEENGKLTGMSIENASEIKNQVRKSNSFNSFKIDLDDSKFKKDLKVIIEIKDNAKLAFSNIDDLENANLKLDKSNKSAVSLFLLSDKFKALDLIKF